MGPVKWQWQYDLINHSTLVSTRDLLLVLENIESNVELDDKPLNKDTAKGTDSKHETDSIDTHPSKNAKKGWTEKHCSLCKKHGSPHTMHNTKECRHCNSDGSQKKAAASKPRADKPACDKTGMNYAQIIRHWCKKEVHSTLKKSNWSSKRRCYHNDSDSDSDSDY